MLTMWPVNHSIFTQSVGARKPLKFDGFLDSQMEILKGTCFRVNFGYFEVYDLYKGLRHM